MSFDPTPEQQAVLDAAIKHDTSMMLNAMAGCAKTTTLTLLSKVMPVRPSLALAFNKKIAVELERKFPTYFNVKTLNGLGHAAWQKVVGKRLIVEDRKIGNLLKQFLQQERLQNTDTDDFINVVQLVRRARTAGLVTDQWADRVPGAILHDTDPAWESIADSLYIDLTEMTLWAARSVLNASIHQSFQGIIDYDDQIYMSALFGGLFPKYPEVMVDEAQDLSPLNHIQLRLCALDRLTVCGDPRQAIYAFRGADSSSMDTLRGLRRAWIDLPLSTTFRCPKAIVARQQDHAPGFTAAPSAPDGEIQNWNEGWDAKRVAALSGSIAILCRNNAPLMACALRLIRSGVGCTILGREIGKSLITLTKKLIPDDLEPVAECARRISKWREHEVDLALANQKDERVAIITDKAECLNAVMQNGNVQNAGALRKLLNRLFAEGDMRVTLSTGHKAKGLEWDNVIHLDPWRVPSKFAKAELERGNEVPYQQDMNLKYVIETRSKNVLSLANFEEMETPE